MLINLKQLIRPQKTMSVGPGRGNILPCLFRELWRSTISSFARLYTENIKCINIKLALFHKNPWHCKSFGPCFTYLFVCGFLFWRDDNCILLHAQYSTRFDSVIFFILNLPADEMARVKSDAVPVNWAWWKKNCRYGKKKHQSLCRTYTGFYFCYSVESDFRRLAIEHCFEISKFRNLPTGLISLLYNFKVLFH